MEILQFLGKLLLWGALALALAVVLLLAVSLLPLENGYSLRVVESGSMTPIIPLGAAILTTPQVEYSQGDVVTFQRREDDEATTHRIVDKKTDEQGSVEYIVKGDANNANDLRPVGLAEIAGKVVLQIRYLGFVIDFAKQPIGFLTLVGLPAGWIVYEQVVNIRREMKGKKNTK